MDSHGTRSTDYVFRTVWRVAGTPDEVSGILGEPSTLPDWWPSVYLAVERIHPGGEQGMGGWPGCSPRDGSPIPSAGHSPSRHRSPPQRLHRSGLPATSTERAGGFRTGQPGNRRHVRLAGQRPQTAAPAPELAAEAGVRSQPPLGHGAGAGKPGTRTAPPPVRRGTPLRTRATAAHVPACGGAWAADGLIILTGSGQALASSGSFGASSRRPFGLANRR